MRHCCDPGKPMCGVNFWLPANVWAACPAYSRTLVLRFAPSYHQHQFRICPLLRDFEGHHLRSNSSTVCVVIARWIFKRRRGRRTVEFCQVTGFLTSGVLKGLGDHPLLSDSVIISDWPSTGGELLDFKEVKVREIGHQQKRSFFFSSSKSKSKRDWT